MNGKILAIIAVAIAVIAGSISAIIVTTKRADMARAQAELAANNEFAANAKLKEAEKLAAAEKAKLDAAKLESENLKDKEEAAEAETEKLNAETKQIQESRLLADKKAEEAKELKRQAEILHKTEQLKLKVAEATNKTLIVALRVAEAKAKAEDTRLQTEKLKKEHELAQIKAKDLKRINFEEWEQQLIEWKQNLEERERAIAPEKTAADLEWIGNGEDTVIDDNGNLVRQKKKKYLAENDHSLSPAARQLAREMRLRDEATKTRRETARDAIVNALSKLYETALKTDRPLDAEYYRKSIKVMYPEWKYAPATNATATAENASVTNVTAKAEGGDANVGK